MVRSYVDHLVEKEVAEGVPSNRVVVVGFSQVRLLSLCPLHGRKANHKDMAVAYPAVLPAPVLHCQVLTIQYLLVTAKASANMGLGQTLPGPVTTPLPGSGHESAGARAQGGAAALMALRSRHALAGVVALSTYLPLASQAPVVSPANARTPLLMYHGTVDPVVRPRIPRGSGQIHSTSEYLDINHNSADCAWGPVVCQEAPGESFAWQASQHVLRACQGLTHTLAAMRSPCHTLQACHRSGAW